jgi:competence ComEA-like helix-hairpin-helix protein
MKRHSSQTRSFTPAWCRAVGAIVFSASIITAAFAPQDPAVKERTQAEEDAWATSTEASATEACGGCHPMGEITQTRRTWKEWNNVIARMGSLGLSASDEQLTDIKLYLTRFYGLVNVNTASAAELSAVLGLSAKQSAALVEYRKAHGNFADAASLAKVAGIDRSKLDGQAEAIRFN